jgi:hypothetical protein
MMSRQRLASFVVVTILLLFGLTVGEGQRYDQGYDEFAQDNLYHDYAMKQQSKEGGKG